MFIITPPPYRRRRFFDLESKGDFKQLGSIERASKNLPIQGCNADIIKLALILCYDYIVSRDWWNPVTGKKDVRLILTVHGEIQSEAKEELAEEWKNKMQELMLEAGRAVVKTIPMSVDCTISKEWTK